MASDPYSLTGKVAIVTGAGSGISRACALEFARAGAKVACVDLNLKNATQTVKLIEKAGGKGYPIECDVSSEAATEAAVRSAVKAFGKLHVLLNGAAMADRSGSVLDYDLATWNKVFGVNVGGAFLMSRFAIPHIARSGGGSIIHIASQLGSVGTAERVAYCTTKGALINMARAMAIDHAKAKIRVNTLSPGAVETGRLLMRLKTMAEARRVLGPKHIMQRLGLPQELARAALFLASDASSFMTGSDLLFDGGYNAW
jgi:NAD(P)-dependent dehydrogenase (short-subunit alcohol dehydrogenase family)